MIRLGSVTVDRTVSVVALALAYGVVGCSADAADGPNGSGNTGGAGLPPGGGAAGIPAPGSGGVVGPVGQGGAVNPGGGAPNPGTGGTGVPGTGGVINPVGGSPGAGGIPNMPGAGGAPGGGAAGMPSGGAAGGGGTQAGCGQGTYCMPGDDIAPPDPADGFQLVSPSSITINPGDEQFWCYYKNVPGSGEVDIGGFKSWMTKGASHHFITFHTTTGGADGSLVNCAFGNGDWVYATSKSGQIIGMDLPAGVGLPFQAGSKLVMNMHLINTGTAVVKPVVKLNVYFAKNMQYKAGSVFSLAANSQILVPPNGTQTVRGTCTAGAGAKFFLWTTHSHKFTTADDINYISGGKTTNIVHTTDWEDPGTHVWGPPDFLTVKAGDSFSYSCSYKNTLSTTLTFGETAAHNEMCLAIGYYFPDTISASCR
jgi:hypothetical protein